MSDIIILFPSIIKIPLFSQSQVNRFKSFLIFSTSFEMLITTSFISMYSFLEIVNFNILLQLNEKKAFNIYFSILSSFTSSIKNIESLGIFILLQRLSNFSVKFSIAVDVLAESCCINSKPRKKSILGDGSDSFLQVLLVLKFKIKYKC